MKSFFPILIVVFSLSQINAQRFTSNITRLGIGADATFLQIQSDQVNTTTQTGFAGYLESRGEFSRYFDVIYSIGVFNHNIELQEFASNETIESSMLGAEVKFLFAFRPFQNKYVTLEAGPALMLNGEFKFDDADLTRFVGSENPITLQEFEKVNPINLNGIVGISAGLDNVRLTAHYHYGFFDSLESVDVLGNEVDGNLRYWSAGIRFYF